METMTGKETMSASDILDLFPGADSGEAVNVLTPPASNGNGSNMLRNDNNLSFLDQLPGTILRPGEEAPAPAPVPVGETAEAKTAREAKEKEEADKKKNAADPKDANKILDSFRDDTPGEDNEEGAAAGGEAGADGNKKTGRDGITSYLKAKIEAGDFSAFEDWDEKKEKLEDYLAKQPIKTLHEMLDENIKAKEKDLLERTPKEFFDALPEELQYAARYVMEGGTDMKTLFAALSRVEQVKALDITTEDGQVQTARAYLQATGFGRGKAEVIEKQVNEWKEAGKLKEKAEEFKPDLDEMQKEQVEYQVQQQEAWNKQQREAANAYVSNVGKAISKGDINGIKLDRKTQEMLFTGLTNLAYPNAAGRPTNLLGHLLDQIQYVKPDFALLAEVTYLLSNPEGYRNSIKQLGKNDQVTDTARKLKTENQLNQGGAATDEEGADEGKGTKKKIAKPKNILEGWTTK